jgi:hypothetical protein
MANCKNCNKELLPYSGRGKPRQYCEECVKEKQKRVLADFLAKKKLASGE